VPESAGALKFYFLIKRARKRVPGPLRRFKYSLYVRGPARGGGGGEGEISVFPGLSRAGQTQTTTDGRPPRFYFT